MNVSKILAIEPIVFEEELEINTGGKPLVKFLYFYFSAL